MSDIPRRIRSEKSIQTKGGETIDYSKYGDTVEAHFMNSDSGEVSISILTFKSSVYHQVKGLQVFLNFHWPSLYFIFLAINRYIPETTEDIISRHDNRMGLRKYPTTFHLTKLRYDTCEFRCRDLIRISNRNLNLPRSDQHLVFWPVSRFSKVTTHPWLVLKCRLDDLLSVLLSLDFNQLVTFKLTGLNSPVKVVLRLLTADWTNQRMKAE